MLQKKMNSFKMFVLVLFQFGTVWCLSGLNCKGDFAIDLPSYGHFVYCEFNEKCVLYDDGINLESGRKPASMPAVQIRGQVKTGMLDAYRYIDGHFHTIHLATSSQS